MKRTVWIQRPDRRWVVLCRDGRPYLWYRVLMWNALGRELAPTEHVHHRNNDCADDRLENLEVLGASEHAMVHLRPFDDAARVRAVEVLRAQRAAQTHCVHGHEFTAENTLRWGTKRQCRTCKAAGAIRRRVEMEAIR